MHRRLVALLCLVVASLWAGASPAAAQDIDPQSLLGRWDTVVTLKGSAFDSTLVIQSVSAGGTVRGHWDVNGEGSHGDQRGTLEGDRLVLTSSKASGSYRYTGTVVMRDGAPAWSGTWRTASGSYSGTFQAHLVKPAVRRSALGGAGASATIVMCDRDLLTVTDDARLECTAMVTDASGQPGSTAPTGDVAWTTEVGEVAPAGCTLASTGGSTSWCAVSLTARGGEIPLGTAPPVTASYPGDETFGPSEGHPELYGAVGNYDGTDLYGPGCNPAAGPYPAFDCGDPVNPATGNLVMVGVDLAVGGRGPGLGVQRTYDSLAAAAGETGRFGAGWYDLYGARLDIGPGKRRTVVLPGGQTVPFTAKGKGFTAPGWVTATLTRSSKGGFRLRFDDGTSYRFDKRGRMTGMADAAGEAVTLAYDDAGRLASATDGAGRAIAFASDDAGHVTGATDPAGRTVFYQYSPVGDLVAVTDVAGGVTRYGYDDRHRLVSVTDPMGATATNAYDDLDRVLTQTDPAGGTLAFAYQGTFPDVVTIATDANGVRTGYEFQHGVPISVTEALDAAEPSVTRYRYDEQSRPIAVVDADHQLWSSRRDARGDIVASTDPLGRTTKLAWDKAHRLRRMTSPMGVVTRIERNGLGLPTRLVDAAGTPDEGAATLTYADPEHPGDVTSVTDQVGTTTTFGYDAGGSLVTAADALGGTTSYTRDVLGQLLAVTDPAGATSSVTLDARGQVVASADALGATTSATRDARGQLSSWTDALGRVTSMERDVVGRPVGLRAADGSTQSATWDAVGARTSQTDALGSVTTTTLDDHGRPVTWTDANGSVWQTSYDPVGRTLTSTDPDGVTTSYAWDSAGQLVGLSYSDRTPSVAWAYDADGRRATMTDGTGTTTYAWDGRSRPASITDGAGRTVRYAWDPANRLVGLTYPDGSVVERSFDVLGRLVALTDGAGHQSTFAYDAAGNLVDEQLGNGVSTTLAWDAVRRLSSLDTTRAGTPVASFAGERDASGAYVSLVDDGVAQPVAHDPVGRLAAVGDESFAFDAAGDVTSLRDATLAYDAGGRLASMTSDAGTTSYGFDASGRRTSVTTGPAVTRLGYDGAGRLVSVHDPATGADATWGYDGDGLRVSLDDPGADEHASFVWGHGSGGSKLLDDGSVRYVYGPGGIPIEQVARDGTVTWIHADLTGSVRALTDETGAVVATFDWDAYGLPTGSTGTSTTRLGFQGNWTDPGTGLQYLRARVYDPTTGQFLTIDPAVTSTHHAYAFAAGDPLAFADPTGTDPAPAVGPRLDTKGKTKNYALAGHGTWDAKDGYTIVPEGTTLLFYGPAGAPISDALGQNIEANKNMGRWREEYPPGSRVPNYSLWYPNGLTILPSSAIVTGSTSAHLRLDQILKPDQGSLRWAACRSSEVRQTLGLNMKLTDKVTGHAPAPPWDVGGAAWGQSPFGKTSEMTPDPAWYDWDSGQFSRGV